MLKIITGNEPYLIDREKSSVMSGLVIPEMNELRTDRFDKDTLSFLNTVPMIPDKKRCCFIDIDKQGTLDTAEFAEYLEEPIPTSDVLILIREYDGRTKFGKLLKEKGLIRVLNKLEDEESVKKVILWELNRCGARITADAMDEFMRRENYLDSDDVNLLSIVSDLHAICAIDKDITLNMVQTYIQSHEIANKFALSKMIKDRNIQGLIKQAELLSKDELIGTLAILLREYRIAWKINFAKLNVKYVTFKGMSAGESLKGMGICQNAIDKIKSGSAIDECLMQKVFVDLCDLEGGIANG